MFNSMKLILIIFATSLLLMSCSDNSNPVKQKTSDQEEPNNVNILALGDSYTIGESVAVNERWPVQLGDSLENYGVNVDEVRIIARTGWTTGDLISAINNQTFSYNYDLVGLLIGVNNQFQGRSVNEYQTEFQQILETAISFAGNDTSRVFVFSIPDYSVTPTGGQFGGSNISQEIDQFNDINRNVTEQLNVPYYYITPISRRALIFPDLVASDNLHFSGKMYSLWVRLLLPDLISELIDIE